MNNKELAKIIMNSEQWEAKCEAFMETLNSEISSDEESCDSKGFDLLRAFLEDDIDKALIAICGWSFQSLLKKACVIHDDDKMFYSEPVEAAFISTWDGDTAIETACKVNMQTFEVYDIEPIDENGPIVNELDAEYVEIHGLWFPVYPHAELDENNITDFWYGENE